MSQNLIKLISATTPNLEEQCYMASQRWSQGKRSFIHQGEVTFLENMKIMKFFSSWKMYNVCYNLFIFIILGHCFYEESTG